MSDNTGTADRTDDWMNPPERKRSWASSERKYPRFLIERKRRLDYFPFEKWDLWSVHESRAERDAALNKLKDEHSVWLLQARDELMPPMAFL